MVVSFCYTLRFPCSELSLHSILSGFISSWGVSLVPPLITCPVFLTSGGPHTVLLYCLLYIFKLHVTLSQPVSILFEQTWTVMGLHLVPGTMTFETQGLWSLVILNEMSGKDISHWLLCLHEMPLLSYLELSKFESQVLKYCMTFPGEKWRNALQKKIRI